MRRHSSTRRTSGRLMAAYAALLVGIAVGIGLFLEAGPQDRSVAASMQQRLPTPVATAILEETRLNIPLPAKPESAALQAIETTETGRPALAATAAGTPTPTPTPSQAPTSTPQPRPTQSPPFEVAARSIAILETQCGELVYGKHEHRKLPPASLTKIVTALTAMHRVDLADTVTSDISAKELKQRTRSSVMGLEPGMRVTVEDLLYGLFLPSGNDAAIVLAAHVGGSVEAFVEQMNHTARDLGLMDSEFDNPHGLDSLGLRSSAYDMALAGIALTKDPVLKKISSAAFYRLEDGLEFKNGNRLLEQYPGAYGVKIGFTNDARHTIVAAASRDGRDLHVAVFGSDDLYGQTKQLLDWAFEHTEPRCDS